MRISIASWSLFKKGSRKARNLSANIQFLCFWRFLSRPRGVYPAPLRLRGFGKQNRKIFFSLIEKIFAKGRLKNVEKIYLFWFRRIRQLAKEASGNAPIYSGFCSKNVRTSFRKHRQLSLFGIFNECSLGWGDSRCAAICRWVFGINLSWQYDNFIVGQFIPTPKFWCGGGRYP